MKSLKRLFDNNRAWAQRIEAEHPGFFQKLSQQQAPEYLWIGCSDSRVPANDVVGLMPGEIFVHRNVANQVVHTDFNLLSVLQFAVDVLRVQHVIVCGHYGCGGVKAAMAGERHGLVDNWLRGIRDLYQSREPELATLDEHTRLDRLCELNVIEQVRNVCQTTVVQDAWARGQTLHVHGWIYGIQDGQLKDLDVCIGNYDQYREIYRPHPR